MADKDFTLKCEGLQFWSLNYNLKVLYVAFITTIMVCFSIK